MRLFLTAILAISLMSSATAQNGTPDRRARWTTTQDGTQIALIRNGAGFETPIYFNVRVCADKGAFGVTVYHWVQDPTDPSKSIRQDAFLKPGDCLTLDRPNGVILQKTESVTGDPATGSYELFKPHKSAKPPRAVQARQDDGHMAHEAPLLSKPLTVTAKCKPFRTPLPEKGFWAKSCEIPELAKIRNVRVCFEEGFSNQPKGQIPNSVDYAGTLLPMVLEKSLARSDSALQGVTWPQDRFNPIVAGGCRDLFKVKSAFILVGPLPPNFPWKPEFVERITMKVHRINFH